MSAARPLGLIGIGHIAEHQIAALARSHAWRLAGVCDTRVERRSLVPDDVAFFTSADELLRNVNVDLVLVSTPNLTHYDVGKSVLSAGRNLLLEKPCCQTRSQMQELVDMAKARGLFFSVAMHASQAPDLLWFIQYQAQWGLSLTDLVAFEACFFDPLVKDGKLVDSAASLGDSWFDSGINAISVISALVPGGSLMVDEARFTHVPVDTCRYPQASVSLGFDVQGGRGRGTIETNWALGINRKTTRLRFRDGREVLLDHSLETVLLIENGAEKARIDLRNDRPRLVNHYVNVLNDARDRLDREASNIEVAVKVHHIFFDAIDKGLAGPAQFSPPPHQA
jgi:hypothetical protein